MIDIVVEKEGAEVDRSVTFHAPSCRLATLARIANQRLSNLIAWPLRIWSVLTSAMTDAKA